MRHPAGSPIEPQGCSISPGVAVGLGVVLLLLAWAVVALADIQDTSAIPEGTPVVVSRCYEPAGISEPGTCESRIAHRKPVVDPDAERWWLEVEGPGFDYPPDQWIPVDAITFHTHPLGSPWVVDAPLIENLP